jgi:hypothetical protein
MSIFRRAYYIVEIGEVFELLGRMGPEKLQPIDCICPSEFDAELISWLK